MIRVPVPEKPATFETDCGEPGRTWLEQNPDVHPHRNPLWTAFRPQLRAAFELRCGFLAMRIPHGTVDHWVSINTDRTKAYDWENYRFVDGSVNSAKKPAWDGKLLDPYEVQDGWFEILLPSLQMIVADIPDAAVKERAEFTLTKLHLRDGEDVIRLRREWLEMHDRGELNLDGLRRVAPLVARAVEKRNHQAQAAPPAP